MNRGSSPCPGATRKVQLPNNINSVSNLNAAIVLAAGEGKRMHSSTPKVLHPICGMPMLGHVLENSENCFTAWFRKKQKKRGEISSFFTK